MEDKHEQRLNEILGYMVNSVDEMIGLLRTKFEISGPPDATPEKLEEAAMLYLQQKFLQQYVEKHPGVKAHIEKFLVKELKDKGEL